MIWIKALHVVAMVTWFAGLFYLPRLFVYHADTHDEAGLGRFRIMERRLFVIMTIGAVTTILLGSALVLLQPSFLQQGWLHAKLALVAVLIGYHVFCHRLMLDFRHDRNRRSARWLRVFNEVPTLLLVGIVLLAIVKPAFA